ncbi:gamma-glutamylcyclotransferase [Mesorhizobium sp. B263B2A]|uniref:gamma-glutamylcyclotransferase n=1 Tax=Mesorhizobium sp. B263B2A TaxID=2876669 RepID=UPI001CD0AC89|nr:gamma-glutamylcyclotransferase [Mesorhizobium sp. B263B2A]MCA0031296.1 gamma-glutamylcyclotransferase [Mesorhizobium sp. B263B2A]
MWIFGYGSLMWDGWEATFDCKCRERAVLTGYARSFTKASIKNWGTKFTPGPTLRVIADAKSECHGVAFEFDESRRQDVLAYLRKREGGFSEVSIDVALPSGERVPATTFVYAGTNIILGKTDEDIARMVLRARGTDGAALDYVLDCKTNLKSVGIADAAVDKLWDAVRRVGGLPAS